MGQHKGWEKYIESNLEKNLDIYKNALKGYVSGCWLQEKFERFMKFGICSTTSRERPNLLWRKVPRLAWMDYQYSLGFKLKVKIY